MLNRLKELQIEAINEVSNTTDLKELNDLRVKYLGKKGPIQEVMKNMKDMQ
ncbi:phenylalanine--tRNA ligase subunit alpha, partial [Turicibacter sanguinis]|nr:phenylalanine--tRNA ligase subunit alpha [Turicibacter sanguinis]